jgi:hypothetical protein
MRTSYSEHVKTNPKFYKGRDTWYKILKRCYNPKCKDYKFYGERGIKFSEVWRNNFEAFFAYCINLEYSFESGYSIDRIDNNKNYEPDNIRFVKHKVQCNNRRSNRFYEFNNKTLTIAQWCEVYGLKWEFVRDRLKLGFTIEQALTLPKGSRR